MQESMLLELCHARDILDHPSSDWDIQSCTWQYLENNLVLGIELGWACKV